ncbi:MAG: hypothetical protein ACHQ4J_09485 [Candidatus Binatia bacterium]
MGKRTRRFAVLGALAMASGFFFGTAAARAQSIGLSSANGAAGSSVTINATLTAGTTAVAATTNDISFDSSTPIATSTQGHCTITTTTACTTSTDCPILPTGLASSCAANPTVACTQNSDCPTGDTCPRNQPCVNDNAPACQVNSAIGKSGFFGFLPNYCSNSATTACATDADCSGGTCTVACTPGTNCTGMRALIFGLASTASELSAIPGGSTLYSCTVNIATGATGSHTLTVSNETAADTLTGALISGVTGTNGTVTVGNLGYTVCDVNRNPSSETGDDVGDFGDGSINIFDVKAIFNAAQVGIDAPAAGTARFSAMDSSLADSPPACGGDGTLNIFDYKECFNVGQLGAPSFPSYVRTGECPNGGACGSCSSAVAPTPGS